MNAAPELVPATTEKLILRTGIALAMIYAAFLVLCALYSAPVAQSFLGVTATNVVFGRAAGMSLSYAFGYSDTVAMLLNMLIETILVLVFYPVFVMSLTQLPSQGWLRKLIDRTKAAAERHQDKIHRYGIIGLVAFVWFPFSMTGPMVGCAIGYMIGFRPWVTLTAVLASTYVAIVCWGLLLRDLLEQFAADNHYVPVVVLGAIVCVLLLARYIRTRRSDLSGGC
jgi:uncharacterized membrane protein